MGVEVRIGGGYHELVIDALHQLHPDSRDPYDKGWIATTVSWSDGAFRGAFDANIRSEEFADLARLLDGLYRQLDGSATWATMETNIDLLITGDGLGHFEVRVELVADPSNGPWVRSLIRIDQTELPGVATTLREASVLGEPVR